jgi:hypothetical protein
MSELMLMVVFCLSACQLHVSSVFKLFMKMELPFPT